MQRLTRTSRVQVDTWWAGIHRKARLRGAGWARLTHVLVHAPYPCILWGPKVSEAELASREPWPLFAGTQGCGVD